MRRDGLPKNVRMETAVGNRKDRGGPAVGIIMGSESDWKTMRPAAQVLSEHGVSYETRVVSAHRSPDALFRYATRAARRGLSLIIAGAGGAAHLPGMAASKTIVPVVGVPVAATPLNGLDALLSIMQMPAEVGVATVSVGTKGAEHAALFAVAALKARKRGAGGSVAILAKDDSHLDVLKNTEEYLLDLGVPYKKVIASHVGTSGRLEQKVAELEGDGAAVFIAGSGDGIDFARQIAKATTAPVLVVPITGKSVRSIDDFLKPFLETPPGVGTFAIGRPGAVNAAIFAATIISPPESQVWKNLGTMRKKQRRRVRTMNEELEMFSQEPLWVGQKLGRLQ